MLLWRHSTAASSLISTLVVAQRHFCVAVHTSVGGGGATTSTTSSSSSPNTTSTSSSSTAFTWTLERGAGDQELWRTQTWHAGVLTDLPSSGGKPISNLEKFDFLKDSGRLTPQLKVVCIASQNRTLDELKRMMLQGASSADAFLLVSGSTPNRNVSAVQMIKEAKQMQEEGHLPLSLGLWCCANPMMLSNEAMRLAEKIDAGATVVLTQPPLLFDRFEKFMHEARDLGIPERCRVIVGVPIVSSASNLRYWASLCGLKLEEISQTEAVFSDQQKLSKLREGWIYNMIKRIKQTEGVHGAHVMATNPAAREVALTLAKGGMFR
jgi:hypothetical protein